MRIGIIGAGNIGGALARGLTALGHEVSVANSRGPQTLAALAKETGAKPVTVQEAARAGDVVIVTIPEKAIRDLPRGLFDGVFTWTLSSVNVVVRSESAAGARRAPNTPCAVRAATSTSKR